MKKLLILAVLVALGGACSNDPPPTRAAIVDASSVSDGVGDWRAENGWRLTSLGSILRDLSDSATAMDVEGLGADCERLQDAASDLAGELPIPDAEKASYEFGVALDLYQEAAVDCIAGAATYDVDAIRSAANKIGEATSHVSAATDALP